MSSNRKTLEVVAKSLETSFGQVETTVSERDSLVANKSSQLSSFRKRFVVSICSMTLILEGVNFSLPGPFFPKEAEDKGLTQTQIGLVIGAFDLANLLFSFVVASIVSPKTMKFFLLSGILWSTVTVSAFGLLEDSPSGNAYFYSCLISRTVNGVGAAMLYSAAMPIAVEMYPEKASAITAIIQMSLGLGLCIGPPVGSALLTLGGYKAPFLTVGAVELLVYIMGLIVIPNINPKTKAKIHSSDYLRYLNRFSTISVLVPTAGLFCLAGVRDSAYSLYFEDFLGVDSTVVGYVFLGNSVAFLLTGPIMGVLVEMGFGTYVGLFSQVFTPLIVFGFFLPKLAPQLENVVWAVFVLSTNGFATASIMNPVYLVLEKVAIRQGFTNLQQVKALTASSFNLVLASGRTFGAFVIGGYLNDILGFYYMNLAYALILAVTGTWYILFLIKSGFVGRVYYDNSYAGQVIEQSNRMRMEVSSESGMKEEMNEEEDELNKQPSVAELFLSSMSRSQLARKT